MKKARISSLLLLGLASLPTLAAVAESPVIPILTRSYDNLRSGANLQESTLTPANVSRLTLQQQLPIPDDTVGCEAQPLFAPQIKINRDGRVHDLCLVCSMGNTVYAYDAHNGALLWKTKTLGTPIASIKIIDYFGINDHWGILSTPVIDAETERLYCVTWSDPSGAGQYGPNCLHTLHTLSLADGTDVVDPLPLHGYSYQANQQATPISFDRTVHQQKNYFQHKQRASLLLTKIQGRKTIFIPFGACEDGENEHGWVLAVDVATNKLGACWCTTASPEVTGGGIWMSGQGPSADEKGNIFLGTSNGEFDGVSSFSESFLRLQYTPPSAGQPGKISVADWFTPFRDADRPDNNNGSGWDDMDLGSSGMVLIPSLGLVGSAGKDGIWYSLDMHKLGKTTPQDLLNPAVNYAKAKWIGWFTFYPGPEFSPTPQDIKTLDQYFGNKTHHQHSTAVVFPSANHGIMLFCGGENGQVRAWTVHPSGALQYLACGLETSSAQATGSHGGMPGFMMCLSANGQKNAILWATCPLGDANQSRSKGYVCAYDAAHLGPNGSLTCLWKSPVYSFNKFAPPVVNGGKLFVPTYSGTVDVYGLP